MATWEASWELQFPAEAPEDLLLGLVVRDLLHGSSYDVEVAETGTEVAVDFVVGDEYGDENYRLLIAAEVEGPEDHKMLQQLTEQILEELVEEAEGLIEQRQDLGSQDTESLRFEPVAEDFERWDMVVPDWLAPEGAEIPFGFRPFLVATEEPWPSDETIDAHGRVIVVPHGGTVALYGIPAPADVEGETG